MSGSQKNTLTKGNSPNDGGSTPKRRHSLFYSKDYPSAVSLLMTCPIELQRAAEAFNKSGLWATDTRVPPAQLVISSRYQAEFSKIADLRSDGYTEEVITGTYIREIRGQKGWFTWSVKVPSGMERVLLDRGRFVSGVQT